MATTMTQTDGNKGGVSNVSSTLSGATQDIRGFSFSAVTHSVATGGTPNGEITAAKGSEHTDLTNAKKYVNTTGAAIWNELQQGEGLESTPTAGGIEIQVGAKRYISAYHAGATVGVPYVINYGTSATAGQEVIAIAPATLAVYQLIGIATSTTAGLTWYQIAGLAEAFVDGTTDVTPNDYIEVLNTATAFTLDHATIRSTNSVGAAVDGETSSTPAISTIMLTGDRVIVAAS